MELTALTELDAVNEIISVIGESPLNTLEELKNVDGIGEKTFEKIKDSIKL